MVRPAGQFFAKIKGVRVSKETQERAKWLLKQFPEDYVTFSDICRAGVNALYLKKTGDMNGRKPIRKQTPRLY